MRLNAIVARVFVLLMAASASWAAQVPEGRAPSLRDDLKKLHGGWKTAAQAEPKFELRINVVERDGRIIESSAIYFPLAYQVPVFALKEVGNERFIEHKNPSRELGITSVRYQFDGDALTLTFPEGKFKGEHRLLRVTKEK